MKIEFPKLKAKDVEVKFNDANGYISCKLNGVRLRRIGHGAARSVFSFGKDFVLKITNTDDSQDLDQMDNEYINYKRIKRTKYKKNVPATSRVKMLECGRSYVFQKRVSGKLISSLNVTECKEFYTLARKFNDRFRIGDLHRDNAKYSKKNGIVIFDLGINGCFNEKSKLFT